MKSPEFSPRPKAPPQEKKNEDPAQKIIAARQAIATLQEFIDTTRAELEKATNEAERARILESMREAALKIQELTTIIESSSAELAHEK